MSDVRKQTVNVTTDGSGNATAYSSVMTGRVLNVCYTPDGTVPFTGTPTFTVTAEDSGVTLWSQSSVSPGSAIAMSPVQACHLNTSGSTSTLEHAPICVANERVKVQISSGGASKKGSFIIIVN